MKSGNNAWTNIISIKVAATAMTAYATHDYKRVDSVRNKSVTQREVVEHFIW